jgi:hypothetical protein
MKSPLEELLSENIDSSLDWYPRNLFLPYFAKEILKEAIRRKSLVGAVLPALKGTTEYVRIFSAWKRMELRIKQMMIHFRDNQHSFLRNLSFFYEEYSVVVKALYRAKVRGEIL